MNNQLLSITLVIDERNNSSEFCRGRRNKMEEYMSVNSPSLILHILMKFAS